MGNSFPSWPPNQKPNKGDKGEKERKGIELLNLDPSTTTRLDLKSKNLTDIPDRITELQNLKWLNLPHNQLKHLPDCVCNLTALVTLRLLGNRISTLPSKLYLLTNLTSLDMGKNQLTSISPVIGKLASLNDLNLHWNKLQELPPQFAQLTALKTLNLYINELKNVPPLTTLTNLESLDLAHNRLTEFPSHLASISSIVSLNLAGNELEHLPEEFGQLVHLKSLDLRCNELEDLPASLALLHSSLRILRCRTNCFTTFPLCIGGLTSLEELQLAYNQITNLDESLGNLINLNSLFLYQNLISTLPDSISNLTKLRDLDCCSNELTTLPKSFGGLEGLLNLMLANNKISFIPDESFSDLTSLQDINLSHNQLKALPSTLSSLVELRKLVVNNNRLSEVPDSICKISDLRWLEIGQNRLRKFPEIICHNTSLMILNVFGNAIEDVPPQIAKLESLQKLYLSSNNIKSLPDSLSKLDKLSVLFLGSNNLTTVPPVVFKISSLRDLCLSNNFIEEIPDEIRYLSKLESLRLTYNKLKVLNPLFGDLELMQELDVSHNELVDLPEEISKMTLLTDLDVSGNALISLPESFHTMTQLTHLKISFNRLRKLPRFTTKVWINCTGNPALRVIYNTVHDEKTETKVLEQLDKIESKRVKYQKKKERKQKALIHEIDPISIDLESAEWNNLEALSKSADSILINPHSPSDPSLLEWKEDVARPKGKKQRFSAIPTIPQSLAYRSLFGWAHMRGRRPDMQDTLAIMTDFRDIENTYLLCVFDGHAGSSSSELAAKNLPYRLWRNLSWIEKRNLYPEDVGDLDKAWKEEVRKDVHGNPDVQIPVYQEAQLTEGELNEAMIKTFKDVHEDIVQQSYEDGTAALVALILPDGRMVFGNSGDQRALLVRKGRPPAQITVDHKPDTTSELQRIKLCGGFVTENRRVDGILALSRSLGDVDLQPHVTWHPETFIREIAEEDQYLVMACDGLWDVVTNEMVEKIVGEEVDPVRASSKLRDYAHCLGSTDNITVMVFKFDKELKKRISRKKNRHHRRKSSGKGRPNVSRERAKNERLPLSRSPKIGTSILSQYGVGKKEKEKEKEKEKDSSNYLAKKEGNCV